MERDETKHEPHIVEFPKDFPMRKERTPDGDIHEVIEFEHYEILKIPHELEATLEDVEDLMKIMDKVGIGKYSTRETLGVWYLGHNEIL